MTTKLEALCKAHAQQGGTIHQFNEQYGVNLLDISNSDFFKFIYTIYLKRCIQTMPEAYAWSIENLPVVLERMNAALDNGSYLKDSPAFKLTCKALGIKHTYTAISEYMGHYELKAVA